MNFLAKTVLLLLIPFQVIGQLQVTIELDDGTFINNAPTGRSWEGFTPKGFTTYEISSDLVSIDDSEIDRLTYSGSWRISDTLAIPTQDGNCYCSWSRQAGASVSIKFTRTEKFQWIGERMSHHGVAEVFLDGVSQGLVDTNQPDNEKFTLNWEVEGLDTAKVYNVTIKAISKTPVVIHFFNLFTNETIPPPIEPCTPDTIYISKTEHLEEILLD